MAAFALKERMGAFWGWFGDEWGFLNIDTPRSLRRKLSTSLHAAQGFPIHPAQRGLLLLREDGIRIDQLDKQQPDLLVAEMVVYYLQHPCIDAWPEDIEEILNHGPGFCNPNRANDLKGTLPPGAKGGTPPGHYGAGGRLRAARGAGAKESRASAWRSSPTGFPFSSSVKFRRAASASRMSRVTVPPFALATR